MIFGKDLFQNSMNANVCPESLEFGRAMPGCADGFEVRTVGSIELIDCP